MLNESNTSLRQYCYGLRKRLQAQKTAYQASRKQWRREREQMNGELNKSQGVSFLLGAALVLTNLLWIML